MLRAIPVLVLSLVLAVAAITSTGAADKPAAKPKLSPGQAPPRMSAEPLSTPFTGPTIGPFTMCGIAVLNIEDLRTEVSKMPGTVKQPEDDGSGTNYAQDKLARVWFFTEKKHRANPAVTCRTVSGEGESIHLEMEFVCNGARAACRTLKSDFETANERVRATMKGGHSLQ